MIHEVIFEDDSLLNEFNALKSDLIERVRNLDRFYAYLICIETNGIRTNHDIFINAKEVLFICDGCVFEEMSSIETFNYCPKCIGDNNVTDR